MENVCKPGTRIVRTKDNRVGAITRSYFGPGGRRYEIRWDQFPREIGDEDAADLRLEA